MRSPRTRDWCSSSWWCHRSSRPGLGARSPRPRARIFAPACLSARMYIIYLFTRFTRARGARSVSREECTVSAQSALRAPLSPWCARVFRGAYALRLSRGSRGGEFTCANNMPIGIGRLADRLVRDCSNIAMTMTFFQPYTVWGYMLIIRAGTKICVSWTCRWMVRRRRFDLKFLKIDINNVRSDNCYHLHDFIEF